MQTLLLCMLLGLSLPLAAGEKTPKLLIYEYESASLPKQAQALRNLLRIAPSKFSKDEFAAIVEIVKNLYTRKSTLLGEVPQPWQEALVANDRRFHAAFPNLKVARSPHKHHAHHPTSAAVDEKRSAAASSSAAGAPVKHAPATPLPARKGLPEIPQRKTPQTLRRAAPGIPYALQSKIDNPGSEDTLRQSAIDYLKSYPAYINAVAKGELSLLQFTIREVAKGHSTSERTTYPNIEVVRHVISQNPRLPSRGIDELRVMLHGNIRSFFLTPENADIILAMVDLMIGHGVSEKEIAEILNPIIKEIDGEIAKVAEIDKDIPETLRPSPKVLADRKSYMQTKRDILIKALKRYAEYELAEAQEPLDRGGLPPELVGIVREYRVGGREQKEKAAEESEDAETTGTAAK